MTGRSEICLVSSLPPFRSGVSLYTLGLLSGFEKIQLPFSVVVAANRTTVELEKSEGNLKIMRTWTKGPRYFFQVISTVAKQRPKLVHIQHEFFLYGGIISSLLFPLLLFILRLMGVKVIVTLHGVVPRKFAQKEFAEAFFVPANFVALRLGLTVLTMFICAIANAVIVHTKSAKAILHDDYGVSESKICVIHHGVNVQDPGFSATSVRENSVLFFGNISPSKGLDTLIRAFEEVRVPNAELIIAGGPHPRGSQYFQQVVQMAKSSSASKSITMVGYVPDEQIDSLFGQCSLVVFPYVFSVSSSGGLSFAMSYGKPVIVTNLPAFNEVVTDNLNGIVVPSGDIKALASAIERILLNPVLRDSLSHEIKKSVSKVSWSVTAKITSEFYQTHLRRTAKGS